MIKNAMYAVVYWLAVVVGAVIVGFGIPLFWIWVGSQIQGRVGVPTLSSLLTALFGVIGTYVVMLMVFGRIAARISPPVRQQMWARSMRDTRGRTYQREGIGHPVETIVIVAAVVVTVTYMVWFFFFAQYGLR